MYPDATLIIHNGFLRPICEADITNEYVLGLNDPEVNQFLQVRNLMQTYDSVRHFVRMNKNASDMILWGFWYGGHGRKCLVGTVRLHQIDDDKKSCYIGVCLFKKEVWGTGLGTKSIRSVTEWAFGACDLYSIEAAVNVGNVGSQRAFSKAGYRYSHRVETAFSDDPKTAYSLVYFAHRNDYQMS